MLLLQRKNRSIKSEVRKLRTNISLQRTLFVGAPQTLHTYRTRSTRSGGSHFPEIVLGSKGQDSLDRQILEPQLFRFLVTGGDVVSTKIGRVQSIRIETKLRHETMPGHGNGAFLEVVSKRPVAQHFEKRVVVHIFPHVVQIVVLSTRANALLTVHRTLQGTHLQMRIACSCGTRENRLPLSSCG